MDQMRLLSRLPGRERWFVRNLKGQPRLAVAVELAVRRESPGLFVEANPLTGRVLLRWEPQERIGARELLGRALESEPVSVKSWLALKPRMDSKVRVLVTRLLIGGFQLSLLLLNRLIWGSVAGGPLAVPLSALSLAGTVITRPHVHSRVIPHRHREEPHHNRHSDRHGYAFQHCLAGEHHSPHCDLASEPRRISGKTYAPAHARGYPGVVIRRRRNCLDHRE